MISNMSDRDRKMLLAIIPIALVVAYYFLLLAPQRKEATASSQDLSKQTQRLNSAQSQLAQAQSSKNTFASDYTEMVRLGKAIPSSTDMPSLIVQLDQAARGTGIKFTHIATGDASGTGTASPPAAAPSNGGSAGTSGTNTGAGSDSSSSSSSSSSSGGSAVGGANSGGSNGQGASAGGGAKASTGYGQATESAHNAGTTSDKANNKTDQASGGGSNGNTGTPSAGAGATTGAAAPAGLTTVPLDLEFDGNFFNLANFFHRVKRMVHLNNQNVVVSGRLITIESIEYTSDPTIFPKLKATLKATVYLSPSSEGTTAGATPQGPSSTTTPASDSSGGSAPAPAPAATSTLGAHSR